MKALCVFTPITCNDQNMCTSDSCDPSSGCVFTPITGCCVTDADCSDTDQSTVDRCDPTTHSCLFCQPLSAKVKVVRLLPPQGDEGLTLAGTVTAPSAGFGDPSTNGIRLLVGNSDLSTIVLDQTIAGGAFYTKAARFGWKVNSKGTKWTYVDNRGFGGVTRIALSGPIAGNFKITAAVKRGDFTGVQALGPLTAVVIVAPPHQCGETEPSLACALDASGKTLTCR